MMRSQAYAAMREVKKLMIVVALLSTGCTKDGGPYVCTNDVDSYKAHARTDLLTGKVSKFEAIDANGISFVIDEKNSRTFECIPQAEHDAEIERQNALREIERSRCEQERKANPAKFSGTSWPPC